MPSNPQPKWLQAMILAAALVALSSQAGAQTPEAIDERPAAARQADSQPPNWTAHARQGRGHMRFEEWAEAEASFEAALAALPREDPTGIRRRTLAGQIALLSDAAWSERRLEDAARISAIVVAAYDGAKAEPLELATHLSRIGQVATLRGDYPSADAAFDRALAIRIAALGQKDSRVIDLRSERSRLYIASERYDEAEAELMLGLQIVEAQVGAQHTRTVPLRLTIVELREAQERYADAKAELGRIIEIQGETYGEDSPEVATTLRQLANAEHELGNDGEAQKLFEKSIAMTKEALPGHPMVALAENDYAWFLVTTGRASQALEHIERAIAILEESEIDGPLLAAMLDTKAGALQRKGKNEQAEADYRRAIQSFQDAGVAHRADLARTREHLAELLREQGRGEEAAALLADAPPI